MLSLYHLISYNCSIVSQDITLVTGNLNKVKELSSLLGIELQHEKIDLPEIQSTDVAEVVKAKAEAAYEIVRKPILLDDTGLTIRAWGNLPGALIKWFIDNVGSAGVIEMLGEKDRTALASTALGFRDENGSQIFVGKVQGKVADKPRGENGFGFDPFFIPDGADKTLAEMTADEKNLISPRAMAAAEMRESLNFLNKY